MLSNGVDWHLFHLTFDEGIDYQRAFVASLEDANGIDDAAGKLALLHKTSVKRGELDEFWEKATALAPASIGKALFNESVINLLRREIRREAGLLIDPEDLGRSLHQMLSPEARELVGPMRIRRKRRSSRKAPGDQVAANDERNSSSAEMPEKATSPDKASVED